MMEKPPTHQKTRIEQIIFFLIGVLALGTFIFALLQLAGSHK